MKGLFHFGYRNGLALLCLAGVSALVMLAFLPGLEIDVSAEQLFPANDPLKERYEEVRTTFGSDKIAAVYIEDSALFQRDNLVKLRELSRALAGIQEVQRVESIFTANHIRGSAGWVETGPLFSRIPRKQERIDERLKSALQNPMLIGNIISADGTAVMLTLYLADEADGSAAKGADATLDAEVADDPALRDALSEVELGRPDSGAASGADSVGGTAAEPLTGLARERAIYQKIEAILTGSVAKVPTVSSDLGGAADMPGNEPATDYTAVFEKAFQIGAPAMRVNMARYLLSDQLLLLPLAALLLVVLFGVSMRNVHAAVVPIINGLIASAWVLGLMALLGVPLNMLNYIVPAFIFVVGATEDIHILAEFFSNRRQGQSRAKAIATTANHLGLTLVLTAFTTTIGFAASGVADIPALRNFGITAAIGIGLRFLISLLLVPAYLSVFTKDADAPADDEEALPTGDEAQSVESGMLRNVADTRIRDTAHRWAKGFAGFVMEELVRRPPAVIIGFVVIAAPCIYLASGITINNDLTGFLRDDDKLLRQINTAQEKMSGTKVIYLTLRDTEGDFRKASKLEIVHQISGDLRTYFDDLDSVTSLADYVALVHREMTGDPKKQSIPTNDDLIAQLLIFFHATDLEPYVDADFSQANIIIRTGVSDSTAFNQMVADIRDMLDSGEYGPLIYDITGQSVLVAAAVEKIASGQVASLSTVAVLLFAIVALLFVSIRCGLFAVVANMFSIAVAFGLMGLFDIPLNIGTSMVAAITLGIGVDDTLHLMVRYHHELKRLKDECEAIRAAITAEFVPVAVTTLGLAGGFLILGASSFVPVQQFGLLSAVVVISAMIADLILTPVLLSTTRLITIYDLVGIRLREQLREKSRLFQGFSKWQVKKLILLSDLVEVPEGTRVIADGEIGTTMFIIIDGELEVSKQSGPNRMTLATLGLGEAFGEIALVSKSKRTADVYAKTDVKLLSIAWDDLEKLQRFSPFLAARLYLNVSRILGMRLVNTVNRLDRARPAPKKKMAHAPKPPAPRAEPPNPPTDDSKDATQ